MKARARADESDELLGFAAALRFALDHGLASFPVEASFPEPPDVVMRSPRGLIAVEVTHIGWQKMNEVEASAESGSIIELAPELFFDSPAKRGKAKGRTGDFRFVKHVNERLTSDGTTTNALRLSIIEALDIAIKRKHDRLQRYRQHASVVWLFLIDHTYPGGFKAVLECERSVEVVRSQCAGSGFDRVLLFRWSEGITDLSCPMKNSAA